MLKMSFSKAKLKRFNDVPAVSSPSAFAEPKEKDVPKKLKKEDKIKVGGSMDAESIKTTRSALSLFRTPSLPRRLKFKHISDLTPKKASGKEEKANRLAAEDPLKPSGASGEKSMESGISKLPPIVQLYNKIDVNKEALGKAREENEELKGKIRELRAEQYRAEVERLNLLAEKDHQIELLERELTSITKADELLQNIAEGCLEKVKEYEREIQGLHQSYEKQLCEMHDAKVELEIRYDELLESHRLLREDHDVMEGENLFLNEETGALREILEATDMELQRKGDEVQAMQDSLDELIVEGRELKEQVRYLKAQAEEDMMRYVEEGRNTIREIDQLKQDNARLLASLSERDAIVAGMQEELNERQFEMDDLRADIRNEFSQELAATVKKYEQQIATITELNEMKIRECESIFVLEKSKLIKEHSDRIKQLEKDQLREIERIGEQAEEKIRIADIQNEERVKALELSIQGSISAALASEKQHWQKELDKCQKIAETEIMQCEFEKRDLRTLWEASNEVIKDNECKIAELERRLQLELQVPGGKSRDELEAELRELALECSRVKTEKYNYQLTLNNTRSTVNILMERLKKSDSDVELLKAELEQVLRNKTEMETDNNKLREEITEYQRVLGALRASSSLLEKEMREKEVVFEKLMNSEEDAILTVSQIGKLFSDRMEAGMGRYLEMYEDLKKKHDAREAYIQDLKALLDEFANGIELARIELDTKDKKIFDLENENKNIKLENMTFRFKCEQFEKYNNQNENQNPQPPSEVQSEDDERLVPNFLIENIINQLEQEGVCANVTDNSALETIHELMVDGNGILPVDPSCKSVMNDKIKQPQQTLCIAEDIGKENQNNRQNVKNVESSKDQQQLKAKIAKLQELNRKQESTIINLQQQLSSFDSPQKLNTSSKFLSATASPKTPKKMIVSPFPGKENRSPAQVGVYSPRTNVLRARNN
ncbi:putative leucine-rich repeat-containing protein DDB_G0290503 [Anopheles ziemanni]|uniref:putative leucine-rich repeat-containing protein DDB_G0290503 n=1 Tax=Anopheles coustani TaxID=139045 RepID=UPI00265B4D2A|nr:putative leucine-rich repeat-containing protein DDB_G0290503 [Anopheles coustani]XP_058173452.1 putative leucine-rich repeat-containing protein DDB_G0290503 [Anopheles ziemanni]